MNDLEFISDVIYGLKQEYGQSAYFALQADESVNVSTGVIMSNTYTPFTIQKVVLLPLNLRTAFLKSVGIQKGVSLEQGEREILVDKKDIPAGLVIKYGDKITLEEGVVDVIRTESYSHAVIVIVKETVGKITHD